MKRTALVAFVLILFALPLTAGADNFFVLTGTVSEVQCTEIPTFQAPPMLQCTMTIAPDPGLVSKIDVYCKDPEVAVACNACVAGDAVMIFGHEVSGFKVVDKIGLWIKVAG
jgi:hypothetical protein